MVTEPQGVLLSDNLETRKRDLYVGGLIALKPHLAGRQSSVMDTGVEIDRTWKSRGRQVLADGSAL